MSYEEIGKLEEDLKIDFMDLRADLHPVLDRVDGDFMETIQNHKFSRNLLPLRQFAAKACMADFFFSRRASLKTEVVNNILLTLELDRLELDRGRLSFFTNRNLSSLNHFYNIQTICPSVIGEVFVWIASKKARHTLGRGSLVSG